MSFSGRPAPPAPVVAALMRAFPRATPANDDELIVSRPAVMGGRRVFRGTRVPVEVLWEDLKDGLTVDEVLNSYPTLRRDDVLAVIERGLR